MTEEIKLSIQVETTTQPRIDQYLSEHYPTYSRSRWQSWLKQGLIQVDQKTITKSNYKLSEHSVITGIITIEEQVDWQPQALPILDIIYEDETLLVVNKPANCVVHPAAGNPDNTLVNALLHHCPELDKLPRGGIIHRLDKDTTGLLVVPKTLSAHHELIKQLQARTMKRTYLTIVFGEVISGDTINQPMGRHPKQRTKMAIRPEGKEAITHYTVRTRFTGFTELTVQLETGRTHQIRVHLSSIKFPIVGDQTYCGKPSWPKGSNKIFKDSLSSLKRQALHAFQLSLIHPEKQQDMQWQAPPPDDYQELHRLLTEFSSAHN